MKRRAVILMAALAVVGCVLTGCGSSIQGTYSDGPGSVLLDVRSGGEAKLSFMGDAAPCSYTVEGDKLNLTCKGDLGKVAFTIHDDGSLTGPPGSFVSALRKTKS